MPEPTILACDYGEARLGLAIGNNLVRIPHPLTTLDCKGMWPKIDSMQAIIAEWQVGLIVVGMPPYSHDPQKIQLIKSINNFSRRLARKFNLPVAMVNEDFSSASASELLNAQGVYGRAQLAKLDQLAACNILQTYFGQ